MVLYNSQKPLIRFEPEDKMLKHDKSYSDNYQQLMEYRQIVAEAGLYEYQILLRKIESLANDIQHTLALAEENKEQVQIIV